MDVRMHINPLNRAATLPRVKHRAINNLLGGKFDIHVCAYVCRVLTAQLEAQRENTFGRCFAQPDPALGRAGEGDGGDLGDLDNLVQSIRAADVDQLQDVRGQASLGEDFGESLCNERSLRRGPEEDRVASEESRDQGVDCYEVWELYTRTVRQVFDRDVTSGER